MTRLTLRPIQPGDHAALIERAALDSHKVVAPTHVGVKDGKIVGYASLLHNVSLVNLWLHSEEAGPLDSLVGLTAIEAICAEHGSGGIVMPCAETSPFYPKLDRLGFTRLGTSSVNVKGL